MVECEGGVAAGGVEEAGADDKQIEEGAEMIEI